MDEAPGHGADLVEEVEGWSRVLHPHGAGVGEQPEVGIDLLRRGVGDPPQVEPVAAGTAVSLAVDTGPGASYSDGDMNDPEGICESRPTGAARCR
jgi:hypothetical protein